MSSNEIVKLIDFGFSKFLSSNSGQTLTSAGTPNYMCPEIMQDRPYSFASDIWSLGCVLHELTTLKYIFEGNSLQDIIQKILFLPIPRIPSLYSNELDQIIQSMLIRDENYRFSIDKIFNLPYIQAILKEVNVDFLQEKNSEVGKSTRTNEFST